jgi:hypothetical protein
MIILICRLYLTANDYFNLFKQHAFQLNAKVQKDGECLFMNIFRVFTTLVACKMRNFIRPATTSFFFAKR